MVVAILGGRACLAEAPEHGGLFEQCLVVGDEHAAFAGAEAFVLVEAKGCAVAQGADFPALELRAVGLAAVLDNL